MTPFFSHPCRLMLPALLVAALGPTSAAAEEPAQKSYLEICDGSAAVAIDDNHFLVAEDEGDVLYLFANNGAETSVRPLQSFDFSLELDKEPKDQESDIEGAAKRGKRIYWITSHGRNGDGKYRQNRYKLFATDIDAITPEVSLSFAGSYSDLVTDMLEADNWQSPDSEATKQVIKLLKKATQLEKKQVKKLRPKKKGLNIEALAAMPDGKGLLIGLRNPVPDKMALVIPLTNADELLDGSSQAKARFGDPIYLDLAGNGLRSMDYVAAMKAYVAISGPINKGDKFGLFKWSGNPGVAPEELTELPHEEGANPEALVIYDDSKRIQVLFDEGRRINVAETECKKLPTPQKKFSDLWIKADIMEQ